MGWFGKALVVATGLVAVSPGVAHAQWEDKDIDVIGSVGGSFDKAAFATGLGMRFRFAKDWHVGFGGEHNPYGSVTRLRLRSGSANFFATIDHRWLKTGRVSLTSIGYLGASWLLFDLYGVPQGSVGPYFGITPLCAEVRLSSRVSLLVESIRVAIPLPQISGVPFGYRQYRFGVGVAIALD